MMHKRLVLFLAVTFTISASSFSFSQTASNPESVERFLQENVINRTVSKEGKGTYPDGKREYEFRRDMTFCNLNRNGDTIEFDEISVIKHRVWNLGQDGQRQGEAKSKDRMLVFRYELRHKQSTGAMVGFSRIITSTIDDGSASANEVDLRLDGEAVKLTEKTVGYDESRKAGGETYPRASETTKKLGMVDGKLVISTIVSKSIHLDPKTGEVIESVDDDLPPDDVESAFLPR